MPDVHLGKGATVGSVIAMYQAVSPAAVGVDIGCGTCGLPGSCRTTRTSRTATSRCSCPVRRRWTRTGGTSRGRRSTPPGTVR
ncbi:RtcB family protein [Kribbella aluminosa]|nr:RtcB family protein [Kribbella aluminosa]